MPKNTASGEDKEKSSDLPLFFKRPVPLDVKRHAEAGLAHSDDLSFAAATNSIFINAAEFIEAAKHYPIVFTQSDAPVPTAVLGLEQENYFVGAKGKWKDGAYIPAYVRRYPFVFVDVPERKQFLLCIDEEAPQFRVQGDKKGALPLFDSDKKPSELTRNALEFCTAFQNHYRLTHHFSEALKNAGLLTPMRSTVKLVSGREIHLGGFQTIDEKKLKTLPEATILDFYKKGWMALIYFALMSATNWKTLADMATARA